MALLDGKQLRNQSTELGKLSGSGIVSFTAATMSFTSGSVLTTATANIVNPTDVVNKEYVDSVAAGLDPKESVAYTTTGNITLSTRELQANGDWSQALDNGDRILVKDQTDKTENGIYVADDSTWTRATDHDGTPANEVTLGNFTFVEYGTLAGSGFVLHSTDSSNTPIITPGTDEQEWTLYSQAGAYTAGTGLNLTDGEFEIDATGVAAGSYGSADSTTTFTVNDEGQLTAAADTQISIIASQVTDFDLAAETAIFEDPNFVDGTTIEFDVTAGDSVTAEVSDSSLTSAKLDTGSNGGATAGYVLSVDNSGDFKWILDEGDISSVEAGNGLIGGGDEGDVTLNLGGVTLDDITFDFGMSASLHLGSQGPNQQMENFTAGARSIFFMGYKQNGFPSGSFTINDTYTTLTSDVMGGQTLIMGNTVSLSGSDVNIVAATGKLNMSSPEINVGSSSTTDIKLDGSYISASGSTFDVTTDLVSIDSGTGPSQFLSGTDTTISASASLNLTADEGNVTTGDGKGLQYTADYSSTFVDNSLVTKKYVDSLDAAQITGVSAGNGLIGGGTAGDVTLNLGGTVSSQIIFGFTQNAHIEFNNPSAFIVKPEQYGEFRIVDQNRNNPNYSGSGYNGFTTTQSGAYLSGSTVNLQSNGGFIGMNQNAQVEVSGSTISLQGATGYSAFNYNQVDGNYHRMNISGGATHSFGSTYSVGADVINITGGSAVSLSGQTVGITGGSAVSLSHSSYDSNINSSRTAGLTISATGSYLYGGTNQEFGSLTLGGSGSSFVAGSMSIVSDNFNLGQTGASFSFKSQDQFSGQYVGTEFEMGASSSSLTVSAYDSNSLSIKEYGLSISATSSSLSTDNSLLALGGSGSSLSYSSYDSNINSSRTAGLTISATGSYLYGGTNQELGSLTLGGSGSSFVAGSMSIVSDNFNLGQTGASFSYDFVRSNNGFGNYNAKTEFIIGSASSKLTSSVYSTGNDHPNGMGITDYGLEIGTSSSKLSFIPENYDDRSELTLGTSGSSFVSASMSITSGSMSIQSDSYSFGPSGGSFSYDTNSGSNDFTINGSQSSLSYSSYDSNINSSITAGLTISATGSYLYGGTNEEFGSLTLGGSGSSFVAGSMSIVSNNFNLGQTGASFSFGLNNLQLGQSGVGFDLGTQSGINLTNSYYSPSSAYGPGYNSLTIGSQSVSLTRGYYDNSTGAFLKKGLEIGTASTLSGGTASIVVGGTGASGPISITGLASYTEDYSGQFGTNSLVTKAYVDSLDAAQITGVSAGNGIIGGGTAGDVTLNLGGTVSSDITFDFDNGAASLHLGSQGPNKQMSNFTTTSESIQFFQVTPNWNGSGFTSPPKGALNMFNSNGINHTILSNDPVSDGKVSVFAYTASLSGTDVDVLATGPQANLKLSSSNELEIEGTSMSITSGHTIGLDAGTVSVTGTDNVAISGPSNSQLLMSNGGHMMMSTPEGSIMVTSAQGNVDVLTAGGDVRVMTSVGDATFGSGTNTLVLGTSSNTFTDGVNTKGIEYDADYSSNFTDRSLVDKAYADTKVSGVTAGAGLSGGGVDGDITLNADITIDGGLTFSSTGDAGTIEVVVDNSTIQVVNGALSVVAGTSQPVYQSATCSVANGDTGIALTSTPNDYSRIEVYVNGQLQNLTENTTGDCYFGAAGTVLTSLTSGDSLYWNSANAGFELSTTDVIKVHYQA